MCTLVRKSHKNTLPVRNVGLLAFGTVRIWIIPYVFLANIPQIPQRKGVIARPHESKDGPADPQISVDEH
jgi:hypothetical protein